MNINEYRKKYQKRKSAIYNPRKARTLHQNNTKIQTLKNAISEVQSILPCCEDFLFTGYFKMEIKDESGSTADLDNIAKGILDSLQGHAYENDRNCKDLRIFDSIYE